jgi:diguanylate cyclase (GGDEF)-like protein
MRDTRHLIVGCALASPLLLLLAAAVIPDQALLLSLVLNSVTVLVAAGGTWVAARSGDPRLRRARLWFVASLLAGAAGLVVLSVEAALRGPGNLPVVSVANLALILWVPCALLGVWSIPSEHHREGGRLRAVADAVVVTTAFAMAAWMLFLEPIYSSSERSGAVKLVLLGYPIIDCVVATVAFVVAAHARGDLRRFLRLVSLGLGLIAAADAGNAASLAAGASQGFTWMSVAAQCGLAVFICAALLPTAGDLPDEPGRVTALLDAVLPHAPLVLVVVVGMRQTLSGSGIDTPVAVLGSILVLGLALRQVLYANHLGAVAHRLSLDATRDSLTGLANRRTCLAAIETALAEREDGSVAVVLLDLDGFKEVNDSFGHGAGDTALTAFADRLRDTAGDGVLAARLGGDEFAVVLVGEDAERRALEHARVLTAVQSSSVGVATIAVGASAGIAASRPGDTTSRLLRRADLAMYEAKRSGQSQAAVFSDEMAVRAERRHLLTQALAGAAERDELELVYQPLFRLDDCTIAGAEALLRWRSPVYGDVSPAEFVPLAEETGLIVQLGGWVLSSVALQMGAWAADGQVVPRLSVNVSPRQLTAGFVEDAVRRVTAHGIAPSSITLEITESAMPDLPANRWIEQLRDAGFGIAMDDFGAGFSSLAQLAVLPVDTLKFDREFIRGVSTANGRRIVEAIIALAADLGLTTVAEGVETAAELAVVQRAGCALAQGYYFSRPLPAAELGRMLVPVRLPLPRPAQKSAVLR